MGNLVRPGRLITVLDSGNITDQSYRDDNNPNMIMRRYNNNGQITGRVGQFRDPAAARFLDVPGTLEAYNRGLDMYRRIEETFMELPVAIRAEFHHDPTELLIALEDPAQRPRLEKMGVVDPPKPAEKPAEKPAVEPLAQS